MAGTARFQVAAAAGDWRDAATSSLPVWTPATTEAFATYGEIDGTASWRSRSRRRPERGRSSAGSRSPRRRPQLQALTDAVLYLQSYPFECNGAARLAGPGDRGAPRRARRRSSAEGLPPPARARGPGRTATWSGWRRCRTATAGSRFWRQGRAGLAVPVDPRRERVRAGEGQGLRRARRSALGPVVATSQRIETYIPADYSREDEARSCGLRARRPAPDRRRRDPPRPAALFARGRRGRARLDGARVPLPDAVHEGGAAHARPTEHPRRCSATSATESAGDRPLRHRPTRRRPRAAPQRPARRRHRPRGPDRGPSRTATWSRRSSAGCSPTGPGAAGATPRRTPSCCWRSTGTSGSTRRRRRTSSRGSGSATATSASTRSQGRTTERAHFEVPMGALTEGRAVRSELTVAKDGTPGGSTTGSACATRRRTSAGAPAGLRASRSSGATRPIDDPGGRPPRRRRHLARQGRRPGPGAADHGGAGRGATTWRWSTRSPPGSRR